MIPFSFIHAADLHLDSPFKGVTATAPAIASKLRSATFAAFDNLISLAILEKVDFVLIAGDVYDGADRSLRAQLRFRDGLARLSASGIRSFVVHGNHDPFDGWVPSIKWPDGVIIFGWDGVNTVTVEKDGQAVAAVSGISYLRARETRPLAELFTTEYPDLFHIALLHCSVGSNREHETYAPTELSILREKPVDYWALGHFHEHSIMLRDPYIVYSGVLQGRSVRETGERGCYIVKVDQSGDVCLEFRPCDAVRWLNADVSIDNLSTVDELDASLSKTLDSMTGSAGSRSVVSNIALTGRGSLYRELLRGTACRELLERFRDSEQGLQQFNWIQSIENRTKPDIKLDERAKGDDLLAQVLQIADRYSSSEDALAELLATALDSLYSNSRTDRLLPTPSADELRELLDAARLICADGLEVSE